MTKIKLRDYQEECIESIVKEARSGCTKQVIVLATGLGKTVVFGHLPSMVKKKGKKTLVLAHREELLQQAKDKLQLIDDELTIEIEQGQNVVENDVDVVVASVPTLGRSGSKRIEKFDPEDFGLIIIDECHHAPAESYKNVLRYFDVLKGEVKKPNGRILLGVTATPSRSDHVGLDSVFDKITYTYTLRNGIENGYLANIQAYTITTAEDISRVHTRMGEFVEKELSEALNVDNRNKLIVDSYKEICPGEKALVFAIDVAHTYALRDYFRSVGIKAEAVLGETNKDERRDILENFEHGDIDVVVNCQALTEGYDHPGIKAVMMARPTKSSVSYSQMIGRGTRLAEGKDHLKLIDFVDNTGNNSVCSLPNLFGVPKTLKGGKGKMITELVAKAEKLLEVNPGLDISEIEDWSDENIEKIVKKVDIFAKAELPDVVKQSSSFAWEKFGEGYRIQFPEQNDMKESVIILPNMLNRYELTHEITTPCEPTYFNGYRKWKKEKSEIVGQYNSLEQALSKGDTWLRQNKSQFRTMFDQNSEWRKDEPTEKQLHLLRKFKIAIPKGLSKGQASVLIGKAFEEQRNKRNK